MKTRDVSNFHEKNVARALGGVKTSNSGATAFTKGDVLVGDCIIECKTKMSECGSFSISKNWLTDLELERQGMGKSIAALAFSYNCGKTSYYVINERVMMRLLECLIKD